MPARSRLRAPAKYDPRLPRRVADGDLQRLWALTTAKAEDRQQAAFRAMQTLQQYLNTEVDGRSLFAGSRCSGQQPVNIGAATLAEFQARWDGSAVVYLAD